jgi:excinuclease ABC subunit A
MCAECNGLGTRLEIDPQKLVPDPSKSIDGGAVVAWNLENAFSWGADVVRAVCERFGIDPGRPWKSLSERQKRVILYGAGDEKIEVEWTRGKERGRWPITWEGLVPKYKRRFLQTTSEDMKEYYGRFLSSRPCEACEGSRLREESRHVRFFGKTIVELHALSIDALAEFFSALALSETEEKIASELLKEIRGRLRFLRDVGLGYLSLGRPGPSLSGGESQRIRLASQIGSELTGVIYVLDEPSIGLHQRDNERLLATLEHLREMGNTVIVVEHDLETIRRADHVVDFGPGAGVRGGAVVAQGTPEEVAATPDSLTGAYLSGRREIAVPAERRRPGKAWIEVVGVTANNLRGIDARVPVGLFTCVTGVSGAGKSTLVNHVLLPAAQARLGIAADVEAAGAHREIRGLEAIDRVIAIDQKPIGRTPRSNPATYTKVFDAIRELYASLPQSRMYGYAPGRFSFNVKGGRCEACQGDGVRKIEMHFLADVYVTCEECGGRRFNQATLQVKFKGKSIADVLELTVAEACELFQDLPQIRRTLETLVDVGLDYMHLGQSATTLSGGEAQRVKLSRELAKRATGRTLYVLDEPSTGLHLEDVKRLLAVLDRLVRAGNTVVVIEHNLDIIKVADWVIDLGPEGGSEGGEIVATGAPEAVARVARSYTGRHLADLLGLRGTAAAAEIAPTGAVLDG